MKKLAVLFLTISITGCAHSTYRDGYDDYYYGYGESVSDSYGVYYDDIDHDNDWDDIDIDFNLSWNAFPDRYGIAYGAAINGPYRYPRVGFYYENRWYPSAWWGSYAAFDPWYSDYYYSRHASRYGGSHFSLNLHFYDFDDDWDDPWLNTWGGYALAYHWFRPAYGWGYRTWRHWGSPWHGYGFGRNNHHRHHDNGWLVGPGYRPYYHGNRHYNRRSNHIDTRSEAARLAARRPAYRAGSSRYGYQPRAHGRVGAGNHARHDRYQRQNNARHVVSRQYKRPVQRQRSTRSIHRYDRIPATSQPFSGNGSTVIQRNHRSTGNRHVTRSSRNHTPDRLGSTRNHSQRLRRSQPADRQATSTPGYSYSRLQQRSSQPLVRNINRYRSHRPTNTHHAPNTRVNHVQIRRVPAAGVRPVTRPATTRSTPAARTHIRHRAVQATAANRPATQYAPRAQGTAPARHSKNNPKKQRPSRQHIQDRIRHR